MAKLLDPSALVQVSRSAIVNIERTSETIQPTPRDCHVRLEDGVRIEVARGYQRVVGRIMLDLR